VTKLRISIVQYLNTAPLVWGFTHGPLQGKYDLSFTVPSQCAEELRSGAADVAIIPAIEYQRIDDLIILPGMSIASKGPVRSLLIVSKMPIACARSIALDASSRSTQALTKILCAHHWRIAPQFSEMAPDLPAMLQRADAALLIGDPALRLSIAIEASASNGNVRRGPSGEQLCSAALLDSVTRGDSGREEKFGISDDGLRPAPGFEGQPASFPANAGDPAAPGANARIATDHNTASAAAPPGNASSGDVLHAYDVVEEWRKLTGLPAVLAVWAARCDVATPELVADFQSSLAFGLSHLEEICRHGAAELGLPEPDLARYLTANINFSLDDSNLQGLLRFFALSSSLSLTGPLKPSPWSRRLAHP
jgi:predicted solute-binding protein